MKKSDLQNRATALTTKLAARIDKKDKEAIMSVRKALNTAEAAYSAYFGAEVAVGSGFRNFEVSRKGGNTWLKCYLVNKDTGELYHFLLRISVGHITEVFPEIRDMNGRTMANGKKMRTQYSYESIDPMELAKPGAMFPGAKTAAKSKYEKGQKFKYRGQEVEIIALRKDGSGVTIRAKSGITKNLSTEDADKMLKAAGAKVAIVTSPRQMEQMFEEALTALNHIEASAEDFGFSPDGAEKARAIMLRAYREWTQAKRNLTATVG